MKTNWTTNNLRLLTEQLNRYHYQIQRLKGIENVPELIIGDCSICSTVNHDCKKCILYTKSNVEEEGNCTYHPTYIFLSVRNSATLSQLNARLNYLIKRYKAAGLTVVDKIINNENKKFVIPTIIKYEEDTNENS